MSDVLKKIPHTFWESQGHLILQDFNLFNRNLFNWKRLSSLDLVVAFLVALLKFRE